MSNNITKIIMFVAGSVVGSAITWKIVKEKYEQLARDEIETIREFYSKKLEELESEKSKNDRGLHITAKLDPKTAEFLSEKQVYSDMVHELGYSNNEEEGDPETMGRPYVISPEEFGENDYETISLTYYADKVLADDMDEIVDDVDAIIGRDSLNHFGEYEEDSVFVRNDALQVDYEILLDPQKYADVKNSPLYQAKE